MLICVNIVYGMWQNFLVHYMEKISNNSEIFALIWKSSKIVLYYGYIYRENLTKSRISKKYDLTIELRHLVRTPLSPATMGHEYRANAKLALQEIAQFAHSRLCPRNVADAYD